MKELVEHMAKSLVNNADAVQVVETIDENGDSALVLTVAADDMGKVIGRQGRIAKAMRAVLKAAASRDGKKAELEIE